MQRLLAIAGLVLLTHVGLAQHKSKPMSDNALDKVTAAGITASESQGVVRFSGQVPTANGLVTSNGTLAVQTSPLTGMTMGPLTLSGNAQQNLLQQRDRGFESGSLQRRVINELFRRRWAWMERFRICEQGGEVIWSAREDQRRDRQANSNLTPPAYSGSSVLMEKVSSSKEMVRHGWTGAS